MKKLAIVQSPLVLLDLSKTIEKTCDTIADAAKNGANLVMFSGSPHLKVGKK